ncbi:MAG: hypothetical protein MRJ96_05085 [Nitrospirales bacterium]|nr:hypothetical protein [Nitrospira sp.]MDR4500809.1 hypothetical protein [Nitrospirales bacterium]
MLAAKEISGSVRHASLDSGLLQQQGVSRAAHNPPQSGRGDLPIKTVCEFGMSSDFVFGGE